MSTERRELVEEALKTGSIEAIIATSSLELGVDMGSVDLVIQLESPGAVSRGLQRSRACRSRSRRDQPRHSRSQIQNRYDRVRLRRKTHGGGENRVDSSAQQSARCLNPAADLNLRTRRADGGRTQSTRASKPAFLIDFGRSIRWCSRDGQRTLPIHRVQ